MEQVSTGVKSTLTNKAKELNYYLAVKLSNLYQTFLLYSLNQRPLVDTLNDKADAFEKNFT